MEQTTDMTSQYKEETKNSFVTTQGGPILPPENMELNEWVKDIDTDMVPMDRTGDPLYFLITSVNFPELEESLVFSSQKAVQDAVEEYYEMNTIRGCTKLGSPNFSYYANVDDNSCFDSQNNYTFGGMYQSCRLSGTMRHHNPCSGLSLLNPLTKDHSCPSGYRSILLHSGSRQGPRESSRSCRRCGFLGLRKCCRTHYYQARAHYSTFWCAANGPVPSHSGYMFGGIYSNSLINLVTRDKGCPPFFYPLRIFQEHMVCLSDDYELGEPHAVPFGGFTSCSAGNPLAIRHDGHPLARFLDTNTEWPKRCPEGYSQHLAGIEDGCAIRYCIRTGALSDLQLPPIKRPPFTSMPDPISPQDVYVIYNNTNPMRPLGSVVTQHEYAKVMSESEDRLLQNRPVYRALPHFDISRGRVVDTLQKTSSEGEILPPLVSQNNNSEEDKDQGSSTTSDGLK